MLVNKKFVSMSMPRVGNTWSRNILKVFSGYRRTEIGTHIWLFNSKHDEYVELPQICFFRSPDEWYLSLFSYALERKSGTIYKRIFSRLRLIHIINSKNNENFSTTKFIIFLIGISSYLRKNRLTNINNFYKIINSEMSLNMIGLSKLSKLFNNSVYQSMFVGSVYREKIEDTSDFFKVIESKIMQRKIYLLNIKSPNIESNLKLVLLDLGFSREEIYNVFLTSSDVNKNKTNLQKNTPIFSNADLRSDDKFYETLNELSLKQIKKLEKIHQNNNESLR